MKSQPSTDYTWTDSDTTAKRVDDSRAPALLIVSVTLMAIFSYMSPRSAALLFMCVVASTHFGNRQEYLNPSPIETNTKARKSSVSEKAASPTGAAARVPASTATARRVAPMMSGADLQRLEAEHSLDRMQRFRQPIQPAPAAMNRQLDAAYLALEKGIKRDAWSVLADEDEEMVKGGAPRACSRRLPAAPPRATSSKIDTAFS